MIAQDQTNHTPRCALIPRLLKAARTESFILRLNEQLAWNVTGTFGTKEWLVTWARIMGLEVGEEASLPRVWFVRGIPPGSVAGTAPRDSDVVVLDALEREGWELNDLRALRMWRNPESKDLVCELPNIPVDYIETTMMWQALHPFYEEVMAQGGLPLHAALVEHAGKGFILAGAGGRGKTTCCERLPSGWTALCDDETLVIRAGRGKTAAHPFPTWSVSKSNGRWWQVSQSVVPAAIFFLEKAMEDRAELIGQGEAAVRINESANQSCYSRLRSLPDGLRVEWRKRLFHNACDIAGVIPAYRLWVSKEGRFWEIIEKVTERMETSERLPVVSLLGRNETLKEFGYDLMSRPIRSQSRPERSRNRMHYTDGQCADPKVTKR